jgi:hypothetical protein
MTLSTLKSSIVSIRTTVTSEHDDANGGKPESRTLAITPRAMGLKPGLSYDSIESLLEYGEGDRHR